MSHAPDWLTPGSDVAVCWDPSYTTGSVRRCEVARVGKRDVVLDNDDRFSLRTLNGRSLSRSTGSWSTPYYLRPADAPEVATLIAKLRRDRTRSNALYKADLRGTAIDDAEKVQVAINALRQWLEVLRDV